MSLTPQEKAKRTRFRNRFLKTIDQVPEHNQEIAKELINELSFIRVTLDNIQNEIADKGAVGVFENGKQSYISQTASMKVYNTLSSKYSTYLRQLANLYPKELESVEVDNELAEFLGKGAKA